MHLVHTAAALCTQFAIYLRRVCSAKEFIQNAASKPSRIPLARTSSAGQSFALPPDQQKDGIMQELFHLNALTL